MSFGCSIGDFILLTQLAYSTVQNARKACGARDELAREVNSLHIVLMRLQAEVSKPESILNSKEDNRRRELSTLARNCRRVLRVLNEILEKYNALSEEKRSLTKLWQRVKFGNGEMMDLGNIRTEMATNTQAINLFLNLLGIGSQGKVELYMESHGKELSDIKTSLHWVTATLQAKEGGVEKSVLTNYSGDDKAVWRAFRRELIKEGFSSRTLGKHKKVIKEYLLELGERGVLDEAVEQDALDGLDESLEVLPVFDSNGQESNVGNDIQDEKSSGAEIYALARNRADTTSEVYEPDSSNNSQNDTFFSIISDSGFETSSSLPLSAPFDGVKDDSDAESERQDTHLPLADDTKDNIIAFEYPRQKPLDSHDTSGSISHLLDSDENKPPLTAESNISKQGPVQTISPRINPKEPLSRRPEIYNHKSIRSSVQFQAGTLLISDDMLAKEYDYWRERVQPIPTDKGQPNLLSRNTFDNDLQTSRNPQNMDSLELHVQESPGDGSHDINDFSEATKTLDQVRDTQKNGGQIHVPISSAEKESPVQICSECGFLYTPSHTRKTREEKIDSSARATCPYCWQRNHQTCLDCGDHVSLHHLKCKANMCDSPRTLCLGCWIQRSCKCLPCSNRKRRLNWDYCPLYEIGSARFYSYKKLLIDKGFKDPSSSPWYSPWKFFEHQANTKSKTGDTL